MYGRFSHYRGSVDKINEAARFAREDKSITQLKGFKKAYFMADRASGKVVTITLWDSQENMKMAAQPATGIRSQIADKMGATHPGAVEEFGLLDEIKFGSSKVVRGSHVRVVRILGSKDKIDEGLQFARNAFATGGQQGFEKALYFADRDTGLVMLVVFWDSAETMRASSQRADPTRAQFNEKLGATSKPEVEEFELMAEIEPSPSIGLRQ